MSPATRSFQEIESVHARLQTLFAEHQDALVSGDILTARWAFELYARGLRAHIRAEDEVLYPVYSSRANPAQGAGVELLLAEHAKIERLLTALAARLGSTSYDDGISKRECVDLIEAEYAFKQLLDHHHQREEKFFLPIMERTLKASERGALLERCAQIHKEGGIA